LTGGLLAQILEEGIVSSGEETLDLPVGQWALMHDRDLKDVPSDQGKRVELGIAAVEQPASSRNLNPLKPCGHI